MTITIQIGNSDDKLTQAEWSAFVITVNRKINEWAEQIHFFGAPSNYERWQNCAWVVEFSDIDVTTVKMQLSEIRAHWKQESIAWTEGTTQFI